MLTSEPAHNPLTQHQTTFSEVNPLLNKEKLEELLSCPITRQIFYKPVKLLLVDDSEHSGAIVEEAVASRLVNCPFSNKPIDRYIPAREIANLVDLYLAIYPEEKANQYLPEPLTPIDPEPLIPIDVEAQIPEPNPLENNGAEIISCLAYVLNRDSESILTRRNVVSVTLSSLVCSTTLTSLNLIIGGAILNLNMPSDKYHETMNQYYNAALLGSPILSIFIILLAAKYSVRRDTLDSSFFIQALKENPKTAFFILSAAFGVGACVLGQMLLKPDTTMAELSKETAAVVAGTAIVEVGALSIFRCLDKMREPGNAACYDRINSFFSPCTESITNYLAQPLNEPQL
jgi:hypothetical protein